MCSGRVDPTFVLKAFAAGADGVLVCGCHPGDCHYIDANRQTVKRMQKLWDKLEKAGVRPERHRPSPWRDKPARRDPQRGHQTHNRLLRRVRRSIYRR